MIPTDAAMRGEAEEYLTRAEVCARLGVSRATSYRHDWNAIGIKVGGAWRFPWSAILSFYENQQQPTEQPEPKPAMLEPGTYRCRSCGFIGNVTERVDASRLKCHCGAVNQVERI